MCLGFFLPCHSGTAFLFNCSIFSNCRDHNFKSNISNISWWVSCAGFLLPWFSNPIPPCTPSPPQLSLAHKLTFADPSALSWSGGGGAILASLPALEMFFSLQLSSPNQQGHAWCSHFPHLLLSVCLCVCYCFPFPPPPPPLNQKNMIRDSNTLSSV